MFEMKLWCLFIDIHQLRLYLLELSVLLFPNDISFRKSLIVPQSSLMSPDQGSVPYCNCLWLLRQVS